MLHGLRVRDVLKCLFKPPQIAGGRGWGLFCMLQKWWIIDVVYRMFTLWKRLTSEREREADFMTTLDVFTFAKWGQYFWLKIISSLCFEIFQNILPNLSASFHTNIWIGLFTLVISYHISPLRQNCFKTQSKIKNKVLQFVYNVNTSNFGNIESVRNKKN